MPTPERKMTEPPDDHDSYPPFSVISGKEKEKAQADETEKAEKLSASFAKDAILRSLLCPFEDLFDNPDVTEICVNRPGEMYYEAKSEWHHIPNAEGISIDELMDLSKAVAKYADTDISDTRPILSTMLPGKQRIQIVMPPACEPDTLSITIRKPSHQTRTLENYEREGFFDHVIFDDIPDITSMTDFSSDEKELLELRKIAVENAKATALFMRQAVKTGQNIVVAGETGSGKTTFMKALDEEIPSHERIITIEDTQELFLPNHPNHVHLFYPMDARPGDPITAATQLKSCLRMKPNRILLAELRGGETYDFINVASSGHRGSITSCHAGSTRETFERLTLMTLQNEQGSKLSYDVIKKLLYMTIDIVIHVHNDVTRHGRHATGIYYNPMRKRKE